MNVDVNSQKSKVCQEIFWMDLIKNRYGQSGHGQFVQNELIEQTDFLHAAVQSGKLKAISIIFGWSWSKLAVSI